MLNRTIAALLSLAAGAPIAALAQPDRAGQERVVRAVVSSGSDFGMPARVNRRNVEKYAELLALSADQKAMALSLHEGYDAAMTSAGKDHQAAMEDMRKSFQDSQDESVWTERMPKARKDYADRTKALEKGFFDDLRAVLTADQEQRWSAVERQRRRETVLRSGMTSGENVDLLTVVESLKLAADARAPLAQPLGEYEQDLDRALVAKQQNQAQTPPFEPGRGFDQGAMKERLDKAREVGQRIKEVNQRHARRIEGLLPDDKRAEFLKAVREASFPRVYRPSAVTRKLDAALGLADLDSQQRDALQQLKSNYHRDVAPVNDRWAAAIEEDERSTDKGGAMNVPGVGAVQIAFTRDDSGPSADARKARRELDDRTRDKLSSILTKDQQARLPKEAGPAEGAVFGGDAGVGAIMIRTEDR